MTFLKMKSYFSILFAALCIMTSCAQEEKQNLPERTWNLVWSDDFDGVAGEKPDPTKWTYDIGRGQDGWGNQELQYYTDRPQNAQLDGNGNLVITARSESFSGAQFTSARLKTQGIFTTKYGRIEARLITPYGPGLWPAFWMLGANIEEVNWPLCGEIDIMELRGQEPNLIHGSIHGPGYSGGQAITKTFALDNGRFDQNFHVFAVEWFEDRLDFFVDDFLYQRIDRSQVGNWVFDQEFFLILNVAVGGTFLGFPTTETPFPQTMTVDYVKVFQPTN